MRTLGIGIGAGLASALLVAAGARSASPAVLLFLLAPLPVLIVALGWTHRAGLVAAATGALALGLPTGPMAGLTYLIWSGLPAWWLAYLALLARPAGEDVEWYPVGRLLAWCAAAAILMLVAVALLSSDGHDAFQAQARAAAEQVLRAQTRTPRGTPLPPIGGLPAEAVVARFAAVAPAFVGQSLTLLLVVLLWAAARIVALSGRLPRPWPRLAEAAMPRAVLLALLAGGGLVLVGGAPGALGLALVGALAAAFALQGLALTHARSAALKARAALLAGLYFMVVLTQGAILIPIAIVGLLDVAFGLRGRDPARRAGPPT